MNDEWRQMAEVFLRALCNTSQNMVDDYEETNASFRYESGMGAKIVRTTDGKCCEWCNQLAGVYRYPDVPKEVYQRHDNCTCTVEYVTGKQRQNVHTKHRYERYQELNGAEADRMGLPRIESIENRQGTRQIKTYKRSEYENIWTQTNTTDCRRLCEILDGKINKTTTYPKPDRIVVVKNDVLGGVSAYNHANNTLYISEELASGQGFERIVGNGFHAARNIEDIIAHELGGHKAHWDAVYKLFETGKYSSVEAAKRSLEQPLRDYIVNQLTSDRNYLVQVSSNAHYAFKENSLLNETIADVIVRIQQGELTDRTLGDLVTEMVAL